jgi:hypothetical protein
MRVRENQAARSGVSCEVLSDAPDAPSRVFLELVFPDSDHRPALLFQCAAAAPVPFPGRRNLHPPFGRELVPPGVKAPSMPKIAVYKNGYLFSAKDKIGPPRKVTRMALPFQSFVGHSSGEVQLGSRISPTDARHVE